MTESTIPPPVVTESAQPEGEEMGTCERQGEYPHPKGPHRHWVTGGADQRCINWVPEKEREMLTVDDRCNHPRCDQQNIYRMIGKCTNCGTDDILVLITAEHPAPRVQKPKCPVCGCHGYSDGVNPYRLATPDEIPVS